jgi:hypothetical protein
MEKKQQIITESNLSWPCLTTIWGKLSHLNILTSGTGQSLWLEWVKFSISFECCRNDLTFVRIKITALIPTQMKLVLHNQVKTRGTMYLTSSLQWNMTHRRIKIGANFRFLLVSVTRKNLINFSLGRYKIKHLFC